MSARSDGRPPRTVERVDGVDDTVAALLAGGLVVLPTDTVYGLAAAANQPDATARIFAAKGRAADVPLAVLCGDAEQAFALAEPADPRSAERAAELADRHWPGPLTIVLPRRPGLDLALGEPSTTVGLRCADDEFLRAVARHAGPIATTSANLHGEPTPTTARAAADQLALPPDLVVDGGTIVGRASTVVSLADGQMRVLRAGPIIIDGD